MSFLLSCVGSYSSRQGSREQLLFCCPSTFCHEKMQQELPWQMLTDHGLPTLQNSESKMVLITNSQPISLY